MRIAIHQPDYIPYIGLFYKMFKSEVFVFLDDCQFSSDNMHHWNRIKTSQGECRLKIPTTYKFGNKINEVQTKDHLGWKQKHLKTILMNYKKAKYFNDFFEGFQERLLSDYNNLADMNIEINTWIAEKFGIHPVFERSSNMEIHTAKEERVLDICKLCKGDFYISGNGARAYQKEENFSMEGITLWYTDYEVIQYEQLWKEFIPNLSIIDFVCNHGFDWEFIVKQLQKTKGLI